MFLKMSNEGSLSHYQQINYKKWIIVASSYAIFDDDFDDVIYKYDLHYLKQL
jgi:hypothetical protein